MKLPNQINFQHAFYSLFVSVIRIILSSISTGNEESPLRDKDCKRMTNGIQVFLFCHNMNPAPTLLVSQSLPKNTLRSLKL